MLDFRRRWWACKPAPAATSALTDLVLTVTPQLAMVANAHGAPDTASTPTPEVQAAALVEARTALAEAKYDVIAVAAPRRVVSGSLVTVAVTVNRQGEPVAGITVFVQMTTSRRGISNTVTVPVITGTDGTATLAIPQSVSGTRGARTFIEAFSSDARAMGAKGAVAVVSGRRRLTWG